ncbi:MAG: hypothetical protein MK085_01090 [Phycisphaerales bacterium]|nr:hypothetical protein [Phycisphaerales bacterium]
MAELVTTTTQGGRGSSSPRPRVTVTRSTARSARTGDDDPARDGVRLGLIIFITLATIAGVFLLGVLGHRAGYAISIGITDMQQSLADALVSGLLIPITLLKAIFQTGIRDPLLFTGALVILLPPIAGLVAARPRRRGTLPPKPAVRIAGGICAALILCADILLAVRAATYTHEAIIAPRHFASEDITGWLESLQSTAAMDAIAAVVAIMLAILIFRLPTERWVRGLVGTAALAAAVITASAVAATGGTLHGYSRNRPVMAEDGTAIILLGTTSSGDSVMLARTDAANGENSLLISRSEPFVVVRQESLTSFLVSNED